MEPRHLGWAQAGTGTVLPWPSIWWAGWRNQYSSFECIQFQEFFEKGYKLELAVYIHNELLRFACLRIGKEWTHSVLVELA